MDIQHIILDNYPVIAIVKEIIALALFVYSFINKTKPYYNYYWKAFLLVLVGTSLSTLQEFVPLFPKGIFNVHVFAILFMIAGLFYVIKAEITRYRNKYRNK